MIRLLFQVPRRTAVINRSMAALASISSTRRRRYGDTAYVWARECQVRHEASIHYNRWGSISIPRRGYNSGIGWWISLPDFLRN